MSRPSEDMKILKKWLKAQIELHPTSSLAYRETLKEIAEIERPVEEDERNDLSPKARRAFCDKVKYKLINGFGDDVCLPETWLARIPFDQWIPGIEIRGMKLVGDPSGPACIHTSRGDIELEERCKGWIAASPDIAMAIFNRRDEMRPFFHGASKAFQKLGGLGWRVYRVEELNKGCDVKSEYDGVRKPHWSVLGYEYAKKIMKNAGRWPGIY